MFIPVILMYCLSEDDLLGNDPFLNRLAFSLSLLSGALCYLTSALYHTVGCHSEETFGTFLQCDYAAIILSAMGCMCSSIFFGLQCFPHLQFIYTSIALILGILVLCVLILPVVFKFHPITLERIERFRFHVLISDFSFGLIPLVHWAYIYGVFSKEVMAFAPKVCVTYIIMTIGFGFYYYKIPERWFIGSFDTWGNSHQLWHIFMIVGPFNQYYTSLHFLQFIKDNPCQQALH